MSTRVYLVRHGETVWNREKRTQGWTDIELNANGLRHAAAIGRALKDVPFRAVYASSLTRAISTAKAVAAWQNLEVVTDPDLRELNQGSLDGLTTQELLRDHAAFLEQWRILPAPLRMPGGESMVELQERAWGAVQRIVSAHPDSNVAIVSHNLAIVTVLCRLLEIDLNSFRRLRQDVAAINVLEFGGAFGPTVIRANETGHLGSAENLAATLGRLTDARLFTNQPISDEDLRRIITAAAGSGVPHGSYHILVISGGRRRALASALRTAFEATDGAQWMIQGLESAPHILAVLKSDNHPLLEGRIGAVTQSLRVAAQALGYGTIWLESAVHLDPAVLAALDLLHGPSIEALLPIGVPSVTESMGEPLIEGTFTILDLEAR